VLLAATGDQSCQLLIHSADGASSSRKVELAANRREMLDLLPLLPTGGSVLELRGRPELLADLYAGGDRPGEHQEGETLADQGAFLIGSNGPSLHYFAPKTSQVQFTLRDETGAVLETRQWNLAGQGEIDLSSWNLPRWGWCQWQAQGKLALFPGYHNGMASPSATIPGARLQGVLTWPNNEAFSSSGYSSTSIHLVNPQNTPVWVHFQPRTPAGKKDSDISLELPPLSAQKFSHPFLFFRSYGSSSLSYTASAPIAVIEWESSGNGLGMRTAAQHLPLRLGRELAASHVPADPSWAAHLLLANPAEEEVELTLVAYQADGQASEEFQQTLPAAGSLRLDLDGIFPSRRPSWVRILASSPIGGTSRWESLSVQDILNTPLAPLKP
jgi:hypothetical protein